MFSEIYLWTKPLIVKSTLSPNKNFFRLHTWITRHFNFIPFCISLVPELEKTPRNDSSDTFTDEQPCYKLGCSPHQYWLDQGMTHYQRRSAFTWADNLVIMFMQFYTEFHKVAMGCRPILDLHKHLYKHRKIANVGLLSLTGQQK